jgi:hypothetical protein
MTIRATWLVKDKVVFCQALGDVSEAAFVAWMTELETLLGAVPAGVPLHLIQDVREIGKPYSNLTKAPHFFGVLRKFKGWYLVLNKPSNRYFEFLAQVSAQIIGLKSRPPFQKYEDLRAFLLKQDPSLQMPETTPDLFAAEHAEASAPAPKPVG